MHDVVVIGAGPAGSMAGAGLASAGFDVVVVEEHARVGVPVHCTGLLGWDAFREFSLPRSLVVGEASAARFWGRAGAPVRAASPEARAAVIDRQALDALLWARANAAGAAIRPGWRAARVTPARDRVVVDDGAGIGLAARACVLACGANYRLHRPLGLGLPAAFLQTAQTEAPFPRQADVDVRFGREVAPAGFAWLVPLEYGGESRARIGVMSTDRSGARFDAFVRALCGERGLDPAAIPAPRRKILPLAPVRRTYADRVLAVGDAAGLVKPTTGGGIYYGMLSGVLAAETLAGALRLDRLTAPHLRVYETRWQQRIGKEIRAGLAFRRAVADLGDDTIDALIGLARVNGVLPLLQAHARFNWHRKAALTLLRHASVRRLLTAVRPAE